MTDPRFTDPKYIQREGEVAKAEREIRTEEPGDEAQAHNGYDYVHQAWVRDGKYVRCAHPVSMNCSCYGRLHAGEPVAADAEVR